MKAIKRISFIGLWLMTLTLAVATVIEKVSGTDVARSFIYDSWVFFALWALIAVSALVYVLKSKMKASSLIFHLSLLLILIGAAVTWLFAEHGKIRLEQGKPTSVCQAADSSTFQLPFSLSLENFKIDYYPGTTAPMDFVSVLKVHDGDKTEKGQVSMNQIYARDGYRFCQNGYDPDHGATILTVAHDPWGIGISYAGYALWLLSCLWLMIDKNGRFRQLLRSKVLKGGLVVAFGLVSLSSSASPCVLPEDVAEQMSDIVIMHNDRMSTLQTFARDFTKKLCGRNSYKGYSAMQVVTGWMFYYDDWKHEPMIKIKSGEVRELLKTDDKMVSLADFISPTEGYLLDGAMKRLMQGDASVTDAKGVQQADEKFQIATMVATGSAIKIFPVRYKGQLLWYSQVSQDLPQDIDENKWIFVNKGLNYLNELVVKHDWENCAKFIDKFKEYQRKEAGADMPSDSHLTAEKWFNSLDYTLVIGVISLLIGLLSFFYLARIAAKGEKPHNKLFVDIYALGVAFFLFLTVYLGLLWYVAGHIPMSNGPETMLLMFVALAVDDVVLGSQIHHVLAFRILDFGTYTDGGTDGRNKSNNHAAYASIAIATAFYPCGGDYDGVCLVGILDAQRSDGTGVATQCPTGAAAVCGGADAACPCCVSVGCRHLCGCSVGECVVGQLLELGTKRNLGTYHACGLCHGTSHKVAPMFFPPRFLPRILRMCFLECDYHLLWRELPARRYAQLRIIKQHLLRLSG